MMVLRKMMEISTTNREKAMTWLLIGAIFFATRSCEYCKTAAEDSKRTKILRVGNIVFKKNNRILHHPDKRLIEADLVQITFEFQKNDRRNVKVHMFKSNDPLLCPVVAWATTVQRVRNIAGSTDDSEVYLFQDEKKKVTLIPATQMRSRLRAIVNLIGFESLGFEKDDIGLHSIRSGGAMAMFLSGTSVIVIQRVGRWSSEAFLEYIRDQVESFTLDVSKNMLRFEEFLNLNTDEANAPIDQNDAELECNQNENGPESIPFSIRFNALSLNGK